MDDQHFLYKGEAQLAGWSDSHTSGPILRLWLPNSEALDPFRSMTARKGGTAGQVLMVVVVEVDDEGRPTRQPTPPQRLSTVAALMCEREDFWRFFGQMFHVEPKTVDEAAAAMRAELGIDSRAELDHDVTKAADFHERIRKPYLAWQRGEQG